MRRRHSICLVLLLLIVTLLTAVSSAEQIMTAHFFYVGQGEATLLKGPDFTVLIDAGVPGRYDVVPLLKRAGVEEINLLINTHPHADHLGQLPEVLETIAVNEVWMSGKEHPTPAYEDALNALLSSSASYREPRAGEEEFIGSLHLKVLNPPNIQGDIHESCIALRVKYGDFALILTGDIEQGVEEAIVEREENLQSQVLQLGHHGSRTSSSGVFLEAIEPEVAIYSAGFCNAYGHPHIEAVEQVLKRDITLYGTEAYGTIVITSDGSDYWVTTERQPELYGGRFGQIDINRARYEELLKIVHIGPSRAGDILLDRPFSSLDDLQGISGIGAARIRDIKQQGIAFIGDKNSL